MKFIKKYVKLLVVFFLLIVLVLSGIFIMNNRNPYKNEGFKGFYYRTYANGKWSKWCRNGDICGKKGAPITDIEIKTGDKVNGKLLYNVYKNGNFTGMDSVNQKLLDNTSNIEALVLTSSDDIFKNYNIYYRTYNAKYGWMAYSDGNQVLYGANGINGAEGFVIEQVQIIILKKDSKVEIDLDFKNETNYGFDIEENLEEPETQETENIE